MSGTKPAAYCQQHISNLILLLQFSFQIQCILAEWLGSDLQPAVIHLSYWVIWCKVIVLMTTVLHNDEINVAANDDIDIVVFLDVGCRGSWHERWVENVDLVFLAV